MLNFLILGVAAAVLGLLVTPLVRALGVRFDVVDEPGERRAHQGRVPRLGGLAVLVAMLGALGVASWAGLPVLAILAAQGWHLGWLAAGTFSVVAIGTIDDVYGLKPSRKFIFQALAGMMAVAGGYGFAAITNPFTGGAI